MTDPREIEGSPERAADRGRAEDLGFSMDPRPSLGDAAVVRGLVSEFAAAVVDARKQYNQDKLTGEDARARVLELAKEYGATVMGRDSRYLALPWHDPARLGGRIKRVIPAIAGIIDPGEMLFATIGASLTALAASHEAGRVSGGAAEQHAKEMLDDTANLILGLR